MPKEYERIKKKDNIGVVVVLPFSQQTWNVRLDKSDKLAIKAVTIRIFHEASRIPSQFIIDGEVKPVMSLRESQWFSCKLTTDEQCDTDSSVCAAAAMIEVARQTFPDLEKMKSCDHEIRTWKISVALACSGLKKPSFETKIVEIRRPGYIASGDFEVLDKHAQFYIDGELREIKSYWGAKHNNRILLELSDGKFWFSCKKENNRWNPGCAEMLKAASKIFPSLNNDETEMRGKIKKLNAPGKPRRLAARQPVNCDGHFPPFVRTCQEILDALDDADVIY